MEKRKGKATMKKLYRFEWDCRRMGTLQGTFIAEEKDVADAIGKHVYFGEVLGKHSDIHGDLSAEDFKVLTEDRDFIEKAAKYGLAGTGYNPLDYLNRE